MYKIVILNIVIYTALLAANSDYLIVENPAALYILDAYEQRLSDEEKASIPSHTPFRILEENHLLSDTYTRAVKAESEGKTYFLVKDNQGKFSTGFADDHLVRITRTRILTDTVRIILSNRVKLQSDHGQINLTANDLLQLIFQKGDRYYVKRLTPPGTYGWINVNRNRDWKKFTRANPTAVERSEFPVYLVNSIQAQFEEYNRILQQLFIFFNQAGERQKSIPTWILAVEGNRITCRLENKPLETNFEHSTRQIIARIEKILPRGEGQITRLANRIIIYYGKNKTI
jgi:hypothetical protein